MWADKMGRTPDSVVKAIGENERKLLDCAKESIKQKLSQEKTSTRQKSFNDPEAMIKQLVQNGLSKENIIKAVKGRFPELSNDDFLSILRRT
jgi:hypothetical protein